MEGEGFKKWTIRLVDEGNRSFYVLIVGLVLCNNFPIFFL